MLERLSTAFESQSRLLAEVSHQLRTPLTVARGHLEVQGRGGFAKPEDAEAVAIAVRELDHMHVLLQRLLMFGRAMERDSGRDEAIDLRAYLAALLDSSRVLADREWVVDDVPDVEIVADPEKLRGALLNLVDNAVKATKPGDTIAIGARRDKDIEIAVRDTGHGMAKEDQTRMFDRFAHAGDGDSRSVGLGLAIVKAVAESLGGFAELRSELGRGTVAVIRVPLARVRVLNPIPVEA
jgi:two-component system OmpR family sensor kinase